MAAEMTKLPLFNDLRVGALAENERRRTQRKERTSDFIPSW